MGSNFHYSLLHIEGYNFERKDRGVGLGGSILIYISKQIQYKRRYDIEKDQIETIWIEVLIPNRKSVLIAPLPPPPRWVHHLVDELHMATSCEDNELWLLGDFNICYKSEPPPSYWSTALEEFNLFQMILTPTRVNAKSCTLIDHIYTQTGPTQHVKQMFRLYHCRIIILFALPVEPITLNVKINTLR